MEVAVLNYEGAILSSVAGPYDMLSQTNEIIKGYGADDKGIMLNVEIVTSSTELKSPSVSWQREINDEKLYDLVVIPAMHNHKVFEVLQKESRLIEWLKWQYAEGAELASVCIGAFILASTGLLDGLKATTHWLLANEFREMFPNVDLIDDKIITHYNKIYTSGGAYSFTTLMVYIIEKYFGHEISVLISKIFMIHMHNSNQTAYNILSLQVNHHDASIKKLQEYIHNHYYKSITIEQMSDIANSTPRTLNRNFKKATGNTPYEYVQKVRIENAKKMLEANNLGIEQICLKVGYSDFSAFRKIFKKHVGLTPSQYKRSYGKFFLPEFVGKETGS